jgi:sterol desaturase/sphingolipid hydroxylase (fatty acid hydroxylase superfamily)
MRRYHVVSGIVFSILAIAQLTRTLLRWTVQIAGFTVPVWLSGVAFIVLASLAVWAFRSAPHAVSKA